MSISCVVGAVGIENNTNRNFKDLEEMTGNAKTLTRNSKERKEILIGPSMAPCFFDSEKFLQFAFAYYLAEFIGFGSNFAVRMASLN